ncbi:transporter substrate-binding domain-containing protein [Streptococcus caprae]|uniref:Transporter substrate-binding domain-containing protein n=1 Tax=Streptococcus caprae TaxID=1640501 RepID=A0ABV8CV07_9STRE
MIMKKLLFGAVALLSSLSLAACGSSSSSENSLEAIQEKGKLVVAVSPDYAPFEFKALVDGKDTVVGSDIELAQAIADELGVELELSTMSFDNVLASLQSGKADIAISGLSYTAERAEVYDFSEAYYTTENAFLVRKSDLDKFSTIESLADQSVGVQKGTIEEGLAKEQLTSSNIVSLTGMSEAINELKTGKVSAVNLEGPVAEGYVAQNDDLAIAKMALTTGDGDAKAVAMPKGSDELKAAIDKVIKKILAEDKYSEYISNAAELTGSAVE